MRSIHTVVVLVIAVLVPLHGCARSPRPVDTPASSTAVAVDSLVGRVVRAGPDPVGWWAITDAAGVQWRVLGDASAALCSVTGATVLARGVLRTNEFTVTSFVVQAANGQPVDDGTIVVTDAMTLLRSADGTGRNIPNAPPDLRARSGQRVWVTRPVAGTAPSYGVITTAC